MGCNVENELGIPKLTLVGSESLKLHYRALQHWGAVYGGREKVRPSNTPQACVSEHFPRISRAFCCIAPMYRWLRRKVPCEEDKCVVTLSSLFPATLHLLARKPS